MNPTDLTTKEDLVNLKQDLLKEISTLLKVSKPREQEWLRSRDVRKLLGISPGTLQGLRISQTLKFAKVGGTLYYKFDDVEAMMNENKSNG